MADQQDSVMTMGDEYPEARSFESFVTKLQHESSGSLDAFYKISNSQWGKTISFSEVLQKFWPDWNRRRVSGGMNHHEQDHLSKDILQYRNAREEMLARIASLQEADRRNEFTIQDLSFQLSDKDKLLREEAQKFEASNSGMQNEIIARDERLQKQDSDHKNAVYQLRQELYSKEQSFNSLLKEERNRVSHLKQELSLKIQENRKLHTIVHQSGGQSDPYDDTYFSNEFGALQMKVEHFVKKHFPAGQGKTLWKDYDRILAPDDRDFFLQSYVAEELAYAFFDPMTCVYGLDQNMEHCLSSFEKLLIEQKISKAEIAEWRAQTIKITRSLPQGKGKNYRVKMRSKDFRDNLQLIHRAFSHSERWSDAEEAYWALREFALDLALSLRSCRAQYLWEQICEPASIDENHFESIDGYNPGSKKQKGRATKIMFGPVYKQVDDSYILLRSGTMLVA